MSSSSGVCRDDTDEAEKLLGDYRGVLHSDAHEAYPAYVRAHPHVEWAGCWAHARRHFFEAADERPRTAERVLRLISELYALEARWGEQQVGDARAALRHKHFARPLARLHRLVSALQKRVRPAPVSVRPAPICSATGRNSQRICICATARPSSTPMPSRMRSARPSSEPRIGSSWGILPPASARRPSTLVVS